MYRILFDLIVCAVTIFSAPPVIPDNVWTQLPQAGGVPVSIMGWEGSVYAGSVDRTIFWGGYHIMSSEIQNAVFGYSFTENRWDIMDLTHQFFTEFLPTEGHDFGGCVYNSTDDVWIFPFVKQMLPGQNFTYVFDFKAMAGRRMQPRKQCYLWANKAGAYDSKNNYEFINGGDVWGSPVQATWRYHYPTNVWQKMTLTTQPSGRSSSAMVYDSLHRIMVLYGGSTGSNETWWYYPDSNKWVLKTPTGDLPGNQSEHAMVYMSGPGKILLKGSTTSGTWIYDAGLNTWKAVTGAATPGYARFWTLSYDSKNDVCLWISSGGTYSGGWPYASKMYGFRYNGGTLPKKAVPPATTPILAKVQAPALISRGSLNTDTTAWAFTPHMVSDGSNLYVGWSEFSVPTSPRSRTWQVKKWDGQSWSALGAHTAADNQEEMAPSLAVSGSNALHMAFIKHTLWNGDTIIVQKWQGSAWARVGNAPADTCGMVANNPRLAMLGNTPYLAWIEIFTNNGTMTPPRHDLYLKHFDGNGWVTNMLVGRNFFNKFTNAGSQVQSVDLAFAPDSQLYLASDEFITDDAACTPNWVFVMKKDVAGVWTRLGGALNSDSLNRWATYPSIAFLGNNPVVAFNERTESGLNQVFVKEWTGSSWAPMGSSLNVNDDSGYAYHPMIRNFQGTLYVAFGEFRKGDRVKNYLKRWDGSAWVAAAGSMNVDNVNGSVQDASIALVGQKCYVAWSEASFPGFRQVYAALADSLTSKADAGKTIRDARLLSLSPNPFHARSGVMIRLVDNLNMQKGLRLSIFDTKGSLVKDFNVGSQRKLIWEPGSISAGIYLVKLEAAGRIYTERALLLK